MSNKYEEAFCDTNTSLVRAYDILRLRREAPSEFNDVYQNHLWCPLCKQARLSVVNGNQGAFFRGYPGDVHSEGCFNQCEQYITKNIEELRTSEEDVQQIENQMQLILQKMLVPYEAKQHLTSEKCKKEISHSFFWQRGRILRNKRIPQKRIDVPLTQEDFEIVKVFYGTVRITVTQGKKNPQDRYITLFSTEKSNTRLCGIKITAGVWAHLNQELVLGENGKRVHILFCGCLRNPQAPFCSLVRSQFLMIQEC